MKAPPGSFHPLTRAEWRGWLRRHHARPVGVWLVTYKRATGKPRLEYEEIVEEALCYGWIDSKVNALDEERSMLWVAPRNAGTGWSRLNKLRVRRLIAAGRMAAPGLAKVEAARRNGSWTKLDGIERLEIPADLAKALGARTPARRYFDAFPRSVRRSILEWIGAAKKRETRGRRVEETARLAARNVRANQWRK